MASVIIFTTMPLLTVLWSLYFRGILPFAFLIGFVLVILSTFGVDTGFHRVYVSYLLKLFEFCRQTIEKKERRSQLRRLQSFSTDSSDDETDRARLDAELTKEVATSKPKSDGEAENTHEFQLSDVFDFIQEGLEAIVDDEVTKRFSAEELQTWNLLTRTNKNYQFVSWRLTFIWFVGCLMRFGLLFPIRVIIMLIGMAYLIGSCALIGLLPEGRFKRWTYEVVSKTAFRVLSRSVSAVITFHNHHYKPQGGSLCVANHTSPIDVVILHCDNAYALVGQLHGGYLGMMEKAVSLATSHIFFDRFEVHDRQLVSARIKAHVKDREKLPILIFPEGTCINNSAVMMFKKGSFEVSDVVYPVAVKYNNIFGDSFWDSSKYGYLTYLLMLMTSWAIVCDVWYMPPMEKMSNETAVEFANRVKSAIAKQGGLVDLQWDGQLKRQKVKPDLKAQVQSSYSRKISRVNGDYSPKSDNL